MAMQLDRFADLAARRAQQRPVPEPPVPINIPDDDADEEIGLEEVGVAEGQYFIIEYRDGRGRVSTRRVTVWGIVEGAGGIPKLQCRCHERKATRTFRVDRIRACIDLDGEIFDDVPAFLAETFGMDPRFATRKIDAGAVWPDIRACIKPYATLLSALSQCDGEMLPDEVAAAVDHCCAVADDAGHSVDREARERMSAYIRRQRPTHESVRDACRHLAEEPPRSIHAFLLAAVRVMDSDGHRHDEERRLLNDLSVELTGVEVI